jgi:hypothetical protein
LIIHTFVCTSAWILTGTRATAARLQKHGVTIGEIEHAMRSVPLVAPDAAHSLFEQRFIAIGRTEAGRHVSIAFCERAGRVRPISAR